MSITFRIAALAAAVALALPVSAFAANLTYHGTLQDGGKPANGSYDLQLTLYSAATGGTAIGSPITLHDVPVHDGAFSTEVDFGAAANGVGTAWVAAAIAPAGSGQFSALDARSVASLDAPEATCDGSWTLSGNSGNPSGSYLGNADNQPLVFKVNGAQLGELASATDSDAPIVAFGSPTNQASAGGATIAGGGRPQNYCGPAQTTSCANVATAAYATIGGGRGNQANGYAATIPGGGDNWANGRYSFAAGNSAHAVNDGSFVWADDTSSAGFGDTAKNQFLIRAAGGVGIGTNNPGDYQLKVQAANAGINGETSSGAAWAVSGFNNGITGNGAGVYGSSKSQNGYGVAGVDQTSGGVGVLGYTNNANAYGMLASNTNGGTALLVTGAGNFNGKIIYASDVGAYLGTDGSWHKSSDRNLKTAFKTLDVSAVLEKLARMPMTSWHFKRESDAVQHIGPMSQDFYSTFGLGYDDKTIADTDEEGVALAAIQGLNQKLEKKNAALEAELHALSARVEVLTNGAK